jgi:D-arginine dehydrogenase
MIVIVGAGYAGAATAWWLARRGHGAEVVLLEGEPSPGLNASGRNAGLILSLVEDPVTCAMTVRGSRLLSSAFGGAVVRRRGGLLLARDEAAFATLRERAREHDVPIELTSTRQAAREIPWLMEAACGAALHCRDDGQIDPAAVLRLYLEAATEQGVRLVTGARVTAIVRNAGRVSGVETTAGSFPAGVVVNAAGAWAGTVAEMAGLSDLGVLAFRRHLFTTGSLTGAGAAWPFVWDLSHEVYVRADGDRLTLCPCDEEPHPARPPATSPEVARELHRRLALAFPRLEGARIESARACLRTFAPDRRYVIGPDPRLPGFFWIAGMGGTGATAATAVGELAADLLAGGPADTAEARLFDPARLLKPTSDG